jgi:hypothetical protein
MEMAVRKDAFSLAKELAVQRQIYWRLCWLAIRCPSEFKP